MHLSRVWVPSFPNAHTNLRGRNLRGNETRMDDGINAAPKQVGQLHATQLIHKGKQRGFSLQIVLQESSWVQTAITPCECISSSGPLVF